MENTYGLWTLVTLAMFPILVWMYVRLARSEERESRSAFGEAWDTYAARTSAFIPRFRKNRDVVASGLN